jgi:hypothetical protein
MLESVYLALMPLWRLCAKLEKKPIFALTEIVKSNSAGTSYLVSRRGKARKRLVEFGVFAPDHRKSGNRVKLPPKQEFGPIA